MITFDPKYPLILDVDGTLIQNDLTHDLIIQSFGKNPLKIPLIIKAGLSSKPKLKDVLVDLSGETIEPLYLPYNKIVLEIAEEHTAKGGEVILCSGSHQTLIDKITEHLSFVTTGFGTITPLNLTEGNKANFLLKKYPNGFHYIGNSKQDFTVWTQSTSGAAVNPPKRVKDVKMKNGDSPIILQQDKINIKTILKAIRIHQWAKNGLIALVPLLVIARLDVYDFVNVIIGFLAMSFLASATYLLNDLLDAPDDRAHHSKKYRPIASGKLSVPHACLLMGGLGIMSLVGLFFLPLPFAVILLVYLILTIAYSFYLKKLAVVDVMMLASLFTIRVIAGAALVEEVVAPWLLSFVATFFFSLAFVKRYTEIRKKDTDSALLGRGYVKSDEPLLLSFGIMASGLAILSFLLYGLLAEARVIENQIAIFLLLTIMTFWLLRVWFLAHRKVLNDDPVLFAVKDPTSLALGVLVGLIVLSEQFGIFS